MKKPNLSGGSALAAAGADEGTGRHIVLLQHAAVSEGIKALEALGLRVAVSSANSASVLNEDEAGDANAIVYSNLGVALVESEPDIVARLTLAAADPTSPIQSIRPEMVASVISHSAVEWNERGLSGLFPPAALAYLEGYRKAISMLTDEVMSPPANGISNLAAASWDESRATWGLQATRVTQSAFSGRGVRIAVLDTGFDFNHPDFSGRPIQSKWFVRGIASAQDGNGHGTHCIGTACGPIAPAQGPRYGVAHNAEIYVAKVLDDGGFGAEGHVVQGLEWAVSERCQIASMSLQWRRDVNSPYDRATEEIARRALGLGLLPIAAAGNHSARPSHVIPVSGPADCPSILSVAALQSISPQVPFEVARFSNGGINLGGGQIDIAAPGVNVYSSYVMPRRYLFNHGTSMAAPHVAGIAALFAEARPNARGYELWNLLSTSAKLLALPRQDVGAGLAQAL